MQKLGVIFFPAFDWAISKNHPEREERLLYTQDQLAEEGLFDLPGIQEYRPRMADYGHVQRAHFCLPSPEAICTDSHLAAAGGTLRAADLILNKEAQRAFALVRPPGHHAMRISYGNRGFCNINMEAIMVQYMRDTLTQQHHNAAPLRVAVVDTDCHHGDGSQDIFWNDADTLFISLHQDGRTLYPGSGFIEECGGPGAMGKTINIPLPPRTGDAGYLYAMKHAVMPILQDFNPHFIINSAGQDNHFTDPLANMRLTARGYGALTKLLQPHIAVLEGGYSIRGALPYVNLALCLALADLSFDAIYEPQWKEEDVADEAENLNYIKKICDIALNTYFYPQSVPNEGKAHDGFWLRQKSIYYDTDGILDKQEERIRLCHHCQGYTQTLTAVRGRAKYMCFLVPRKPCEKCLQECVEKAHQAKKRQEFAAIHTLYT